MSGLARHPPPVFPAAPPPDGLRTTVALPAPGGGWGFLYEARAKTGAIEVPKMFRLRIPVFYGEPPTELNAFLRYRIEGGALALGLELHRPVFVRQAVLEAIGQEIRNGTGCPLHVCA